MMYKKALNITVVLVLSLGAITLGYAFVPQTINYQGHIEDSAGNPVNGDVNITFTIYNAPTGGDVLWSETQTVTVTDGVFNVLLGSQNSTIANAFDGNERYLGVQVGLDEEMSPRQRLTSVPYAMRALSAACNPGDFINCYTGTPGTLNVGKCVSGIRTCGPEGTFGGCVGEVPPAAELCDTLDNDCDPVTPDGSEEPTYGNLCDGADSDLCLEGNVYCTGVGGLACSDSTGDTLDLCNGDTNDDCNAVTPDGSGETWLDIPCDGPDADLCEEGTYVCSAGAQTCSDSTGDTVEICDGLDNNCDAWIDEGCMCIEFDTQSCYSGPVATFNIGECTSGTQTCIAEDVWGACEGEVVPSAEACDGLDNNCDGQVDEGC